MPGASAEPMRKPRRPRPEKGGVGVGAILLLLAAASLVVPAVTTLWFRSTLYDAGSVRSILADSITNEEVAEPIAEDLIEKLGGTLEIDEGEVVDRLSDDDFADAWGDAVESAHGDLMDMRSGDADRVELDFEGVVELLVDEGLASEQALDRDTTITVLDSGDQGQVEDTAGLIDTFALVLPVLVLLLGGIGIAIARNRPRAVSILGMAVAVVAALSVLVTVTVPGALVRALASDETSGAAEEITGAITSSLVRSLVITLVVALAATLGAMFFERSRRSNQPPPVAWPGT